MRNTMAAFVAGVAVGGIAIWIVQHNEVLNGMGNRSSTHVHTASPAPASIDGPMLSPDDVHLLNVDRTGRGTTSRIHGALFNPHDIGFDDVEVVVRSASGVTIVIEIGYIESLGHSRFVGEHEGVFREPRAIRVRGTPRDS